MNSKTTQASFGLALAVLCLLGHAAAAQHTIGIKAGASYSTIGSSIINYGGTAGFQAGGFYQRPLSEKVALQAGLALAQRGASDEVFLTDETGLAIGSDRQHIRLNYLDLPVGVAISLGQAMYLGTGLQVSLLLSNQQKGLQRLGGPGSSNFGWRRFDVASFLAVGRTITGSLAAELRGSLSFIEPYQRKNDLFYTFSHTSLQLSAVYTLN